MQCFPGPQTHLEADGQESEGQESERQVWSGEGAGAQGQLYRGESSVVARPLSDAP